MGSLFKRLFIGGGIASEDGAGRFAFRFTCWFVLLCSSALGLNVAINPYGMYATHWLNPIVWSDRREKLELLQALPERADLLILGSSRMMRVSPAELKEYTGLDGFNLAVNHARTEDFLALLRYSVLKNGLKPRVVLVGLDIHAFRGFYQMDNLLKYYPELAYYTQSESRSRFIYPLSVNWTRFTKGLSFHQLRMSVTALNRYLREGAWENSYKFAADGTLTYNLAEDEAPESNVLATWLEEAVDRYRLDFKGFGGISEARLNYFHSLAAFCSERNIKLVAVLLPYQPEFLAGLKGSEFEILNREWKQSLERILTGANVELVDAQDIEIFKGDPALFYDEIHMMSVNSARMARYAITRAGLEVGHPF